MDPTDPIILGGAAAVVVALIVIMKVVKSKPGEGSYRTPGATRLAKSGKYMEAAKLALNAEIYDEAVDLFIQAREPGQAARAAARAGKKKQAAELFEFAGDKKAAAHYYDQCGMSARADELRTAGGISMADAPPPPTPTPPRAQTGFLAPPAVVTADMLAKPDPEAEALAKKPPRERADILLAKGDVRGAAEALRQGNFIEEAVYLYVNVLGETQNAAPLVADLGNHDRAAELYELAGDSKRAALEWARAALKSGKPLTYLERIEQHDPEHAQNFLKSAAEAEPLSQENADLHYELARLYSRQGQLESALQRFQDLVGRFGSYKDCDEQIVTLRVNVGNAPRSQPRPSMSPPTGQTDVKPAALSPDQLEKLVAQVASAAAEQIRARTIEDLFSQRSANRRSTSVHIHIQGLEREPLALNLAFDDAAFLAKMGPNIQSLLKFIGGRECDLQNIEVFYRLGLAQQARGDWEAALKAFDAVEDCSPGYRDGWKRADEIRNWKNAINHTRMKPIAEDPVKNEWAKRYELMGELGRGGMAVVYRAKDRILEREVAMKFMSENLQGDDLADLFTREAKAVAALNHPNIVTIYDFGTYDERLFICMEFIEGRTTESLLDERSLTVVDSLRILKQTLDGLGYAHQRHIVHRDIKPANIMRLTDGRVKIMDFGLAKATKDQKKSSMIAGTPAYMPPEQLSGRELDHRADLFAVGVSMYELLTYSLPFDGMERQTPPAPMSSIVPAIPKVLDETVARALAFDPAKRFQTAEEMAEPIAAVLAAVKEYAAAPKAKPVAPLPLGTAATMAVQSNSVA